MECRQIPLGRLQTNCYLLIKEDTCILIDPGDEGEKLAGIIDQLNLKPQAVLLTHAHFDHIGAVDAIRDHYKIPVYVHEKEAKWLIEPSLNSSQSFIMENLVRLKPADYFFADERMLTISDFTFQIFETPGHSPGGVSLYFKKEGIVFVGDALFRGSIGRTDLTGGNREQLLRSIHEKLLTLPEETLVLPGHGPTTTIGVEMDSNPFLHGF